MVLESPKSNYLMIHYLTNSNGHLYPLHVHFLYLYLSFAFLRKTNTIPFALKFSNTNRYRIFFLVMSSIASSIIKNKRKNSIGENVNFLYFDANKYFILFKLCLYLHIQQRTYHMTEHKMLSKLNLNLGFVW